MFVRALAPALGVGTALLMLSGHLLAGAAQVSDPRIFMQRGPNKVLAPPNGEDLVTDASTGQDLTKSFVAGPFGARPVTTGQKAYAPHPNWFFPTANNEIDDSEDMSEEDAQTALLAGMGRFGGYKRMGGGPGIRGWMAATDPKITKVKPSNGHRLNYSFFKLMG